MVKACPSPGAFSEVYGVCLGGVCTLGLGSGMDVSLKGRESDQKKQPSVDLPS